VKLSTVGAPTPRVSETKVKRAEAPRVLEYSWGENEMRWELEPQGSGTRLTLWHSIGRRFVAMGAAGWHICFDVLDHLLAGHPIGRIVAGDAMQFEWQRLNAEYSKQFGIEVAISAPHNVIGANYENQTHEDLRERSGESAALLYRRSGLREGRRTFTQGPFRWLTVASREEPDGTERQLALNDDPAARALPASDVRERPAGGHVYVDEVQREHDRMKPLGAEFTMRRDQGDWLDDRHAERHVWQSDSESLPSTDGKAD
jgi:hypothetical protein